MGLAGIYFSSRGLMPFCSLLTRPVWVACVEGRLSYTVNTLTCRAHITVSTYTFWTTASDTTSVGRLRRGAGLIPIKYGYVPYASHCNYEFWTASLIRREGQATPCVIFPLYLKA